MKILVVCAISLLASLSWASPKGSCKARDIEAAAERAPGVFSNGHLYGYNIFKGTRARGTDGYLACAATVSSILREAGCRCIEYTLDVRVTYNEAMRSGWSEVKGAIQPGDILIWNTLPGANIFSGYGVGTLYPGVGKDHQHRKVLYRHIGIATSRFTVVDNTPGKGPQSKLISGFSKLQYSAPVVLRLKGDRGCLP